MKFNEILVESKPAAGRDMQHLEDNMIVDGAQGAINSLNDLRNLVSDPQAVSVKWDGQMAIYWGHNKNGDFFLIPNAQWSKKLAVDKAGLAQEIQSTGRKRADQSDEDFSATRRNLAGKYMKLWDIFANASSGTVGFFKGDIMFTDPQQPDENGNYVFTPNKVTYTVSPNGLFGKMKTAQVFITVHGRPTEFGSSELSPASPAEINKLNSTPQLIAIGAVRPESGIKLNTKPIDALMVRIRQQANAINAISNFSAARFTTIKQLLYTYSIQLGKSNGNLDFNTWLDSSKISENQKVLVRELQKKPEWNIFWSAFADMSKIKNLMFDQLTKQQGNEMAKTLGITASVGGKPGGEGYVTSAGKIINPSFRSAPSNPRFTGEIG